MVVIFVVNPSLPCSVDYSTRAIFLTVHKHRTGLYCIKVMFPLWERWGWNRLSLIPHHSARPQRMSKTIPHVFWQFLRCLASPPVLWTTQDMWSREHGMMMMMIWWLWVFFFFFSAASFAPDWEDTCSTVSLRNCGTYSCSLQNERELPNSKSQLFTSNNRIKPIRLLREKAEINCQLKSYGTAMGTIEWAPNQNALPQTWNGNPPKFPLNSNCKPEFKIRWLG